MPEPVFETAANRTLNECLSIASLRGAEYADSWALSNTRAPFTEAFLGRLGITLPKEELRLVVLSALADVKISRITSGGQHRRDNYVDLVNYCAALASLRDEYEARHVQKNSVTPLREVHPLERPLGGDTCGVPARNGHTADPSTV